MRKIKSFLPCYLIIIFSYLHWERSLIEGKGDELQIFYTFIDTVNKSGCTWLMKKYAQEGNALYLPRKQTVFLKSDLDLVLSGSTGDYLYIQEESRKGHCVRIVNNSDGVGESGICSVYSCYWLNCYNRLELERVELINKTIRATVTTIPGMVNVRHNRDGSIINITGYLGQVWNTLQERLQFRTTWINPASGSLGQITNGSYDGIIGELQNKRADVAVAPLSITELRFQYVDFSMAVDFEMSKFAYYSTSEEYLTDWMTFFDSFSWQTWAAVGIIWILTSLLSPFVVIPNNLSLGDSFLTFLGAVTMQGCEKVPINVSGRIVFMSYWLMSVVIYASYTAGLTTELALVKVKTFETLDEILDDGYSITVVEGSSHYQAIMNEKKDKLMLQIQEEWSQNNYLLLSSPVEGLDMITRGKIMYLSDRSTIFYETSSNCSFHMAAVDLSPGYTHFAYAKDFPFKDIIDAEILSMTQAGVLRRIISVGIRKDINVTSCGFTSNRVRSLGLEKTLLPVAIFSVGALLSIIFLKLESSFSFMWKKMYRNVYFEPKKVYKTASLSRNVKFHRSSIHR